MPRSRHRHKHHHHAVAAQHPPHAHGTAKTVRRNPITIMVVFVALLGVIVALIAAGPDPVWLLTGAFTGAIAGYFIGRGMNQLAEKNK